MEVQVEAVGGELPEGSYVAVRIGDVQKQTLYDPSKLFRFSDIRRFGRVEVYLRAGTCDLVWGGEEAEEQVCNLVNSAFDTGLQLRLSTRPSGTKTQLGDSTSSIDQSLPIKSKKVQDCANIDAKKYLKEHDVEGMLSGAMRALLKEMPGDAPGYLRDYINSHFCKKTAEQKKVVSQKPEQASPRAAKVNQKPAEANRKPTEANRKPTEAKQKPAEANQKPAEANKGPVTALLPFSEYYKRHVLPPRRFDFLTSFHDGASWPAVPRARSEDIGVPQTESMGSSGQGALLPTADHQLLAWHLRPSVCTWLQGEFRTRKRQAQYAGSQTNVTAPSTSVQYYTKHVLPGRADASFFAEFHRQHFPRTVCFLPGDRVKFKGSNIGTVEANNGDGSYTVVRDSVTVVDDRARVVCTRGDLMKVSTCPNGHTLRHQTAIGDDWVCDIHKDASQWNCCRSGITGFNQTQGMSRFQCAECDYDVCELCFLYREGFCAGLYVPGELVKASYKDLTDWQLAEIKHDFGDGTYKVEWLSGATDSNVLHCRDICSAPNQVNDEGAPVVLGNRRLRHLPGGDGTGRYYCGRQFVQGVMDSIDARCGPDGGQQCKSCQRFQQMYFPNGGLPCGWTADWDSRTNEPFYVKGKLSQWQRPLPDVTCPEGHRLEPLGSMPEGWSCGCLTEEGGCKSRATDARHAAFGCQKCGYHMCERCLLMRSGNDVPQIKNDEGAPLQCDAHREFHYCGLQHSVDSSSRCGPERASQCPACERFNLQEAQQPPCPTCKKPMSWITYTEGASKRGWHCNNSLTCNGRCINQGWTRWVCESCDNDLCIHCGEVAMKNKERTRVLTVCHPHNLYRFQDDSRNWFCSVQSHKCTRQSGGHGDRWSCRQCNFDLCAACKEYWRVDAVQVSTHKHPLVPHSNFDTTWRCSERCVGCTRDTGGPTVRWSCRECRYDLCRGCVDHWRVPSAPTVNDQRQACWSHKIRTTCSEKVVESLRTGELQNMLTRELGAAGLSRRAASIWSAKPSIVTWLNLPGPQAARSRVQIEEDLMSASRKVEEHVDPLQQKDNEDEADWALRFEVCTKLRDALKDGSLEVALAEVCAGVGDNGQQIDDNNGEESDVRSQVHAAMQRSLEDGCLEKIFSEIKAGPSHLEDPGQESSDRSMLARSVMSDSVNVSDLPDCSQQQTSSSQEACDSAKKEISGDTSGGSQHDVKFDGDSDDIEHLRTKVRDHMVDSLHEGTLNEVVELVEEQRPVEMARTSEREANEEQVEVEKLRCWAQDVLLAALADGTLQQALSDVAGSRTGSN